MRQEPSAASARAATGGEDLVRAAHAHGLRCRVMEMDLLRAFLCVAKFGSLSAAARALDRTQAAVSLQVKRLEEVADAALFVRHQRGVALTKAGTVLRGHAESILRLNVRALEAVRPGRLCGTVRVGAIDHYAIHVLPTLIAQFQSVHPEVRIEVETRVSQSARGRLGDDLDLLISLKLEAGAGKVLRRERVTWAAGLDSQVQRSIPLPVALGLDGGLLRQLAIDGLQASARDWRVAFQSGNTAALHASVAAGLAVGVFRRDTLGAELRPLTQADGFAPLPEVLVSLDLPPGTASRLVAAFAELVLRNAGDPSP